MSETGIELRVRVLERDVRELKDGKPDVIAERVTRLSQDVVELEQKVDSLRRVLMGFLATFAFTGISIVVAIVAVFGTQ